MSNDPMEIHNREREDRMKRVVTTRDSIVMPSLDLHNRKQSENNARIEQHEKDKARDLFRRMWPGREIPAELQDTPPAA